MFLHCFYFGPDDERAESSLLLQLQRRHRSMPNATVPFDGLGGKALPEYFGEGLSLQVTDPCTLFREPNHIESRLASDEL